MQGVIPIFNFSSLAPLTFNNVFIPVSSRLTNKYMADVVQRLERTVVVRKTGVRFSPSAFSLENFGAVGTIGADCPHSL
tara:strand:- start:352 stop:588 length:237 start_codon:yes stop_codon:yes gene_type:complete